MWPSCAAALREYDDPGEAAAAYAAATTPALRERYNYLTALDAQRHRMWMGGPVDLAHGDGDYALFSMIAVGAAPTIDHVFRVFIRRIGFLASTAVLDSPTSACSAASRTCTASCSHRYRRRAATRGDARGRRSRRNRRIAY